MTKEEIFISLVIPAYNEAEGIASTLERVSGYFSQKDYAFEIIVVDDGSTDNTREIIKNLSYNVPGVRLMGEDINKGKGFSIKQGMLQANGKYILFCDADLSTPIEELDKIVPFFAQGYDVIIGSRALQGPDLLKQPFIRHSMGKIFNLLTRLLGLTRLKDTQCGFKCFSRDAAYDIFNRQRHDGFCFDVEILYLTGLLGYRVKDVPVKWFNRKDSRVKIIRDPLRMLFGLFSIKAHILLGTYGKK